MAVAGFRLLAAAAQAAIAGCASVVVDQRSFEGTQWHIAAIDGEPTPASNEYSMQFKGGRLYTGLGCNGGSGDFRVIAGQLIVSSMITTQRACVDIHRMQMEESALRVLRLPMQLGRDAKTGDTTLGNGAGSIALVPAVTGHRI